MLEPVKRLIMSAYPYLAILVPPLRLVPIDALFSIVDAVEVGLKHKLKADFNIRNPMVIFRMMQELGEAAVIRTEKERREAAYFVLVVVTDIEDYLTLEDFMAMDTDTVMPLV